MGKTIKINEKQNITDCNIKIIFQNIYTGKKRYSYYKNTITATGKAATANWMTTYITYGAVCTGAFPANPAVATILVTELDRVTLAAISSSGGIVSTTSFFGAADAIGTLTGFGLFGGTASATPDSGTLINYAAISEVKTTSETMTVNCIVTLA